MVRSQLTYALKKARLHLVILPIREINREYVHVHAEYALRRRRQQPVTKQLIPSARPWTAWRDGNMRDGNESILRVAYILAKALGNNRALEIASVHI